jgi:predicted deacylase
VPAGSDSALSIPVAVIHGARPGPVVAFVAGSHGTEYSSIVALQRLIPRIDAKALAGTVTSCRLQHRVVRADDTASQSDRPKSMNGITAIRMELNRNARWRSSPVRSSRRRMSSLTSTGRPDENLDP